MNSSQVLSYSPAAQRQMFAEEPEPRPSLEIEKVGVVESGIERPSIISAVSQFIV